MEQIDSTDPHMATPSRGDKLAPSAFTPADLIAVPPNAVELLRESIRTRKDGHALTDRTREAIALICEEAHRADAMPEQLLVAIKQLFDTLPEVEKMPDARERGAFRDELIKLAIEEYYRV